MNEDSNLKNEFNEENNNIVNESNRSIGNKSNKLRNIVLIILIVIILIINLLVFIEVNRKNNVGKDNNIKEPENNNIDNSNLNNKPHEVNCTFDGELKQGTEYVRGDFTYRYKQENVGSKHAITTVWGDIDKDGWGVVATRDNIESVTPDSICTSINGKPLVSVRNMFQGVTIKNVKLKSLNVTDMSYMFNFSQIKSLNLSEFDTSQVKNMSSMFSNAKITELIGLNTFDTSNVTNMRSMFASSQVTTLNLSNFDTSKVTNMSGMFMGSYITTLDLSSFDTSNVTDMSYMFASSKVIALNLSNFNTNKVIDMSWMFSSSQVEILDLSSFDTTKVTDMRFMFYNSQATTGYAKSIEDADRFNTSSDKPSTLTFVIK